MTENKLAKKLLNAVWEEDLNAAELAIYEGADPSWIFNGYPLLIHAVFTRNEAMVQRRWALHWNRASAVLSAHLHIAVSFLKHMRHRKHLDRCRIDMRH